MSHACSVQILAVLTALILPVATAAAQEWPTIPEPVAVNLDPATTAFLVLDINSAFCSPRPACVATVTSIVGLLAQARAAGVAVVYSNSTAPGATMLPDVAPQAGDPIVTARADKFLGTDLQAILDSQGIRTVVIVGTASNGAVLYTTFGATVRGYTTVIAEDGISATDFATFVTRWQVLNQPGIDNPENRPLEPGRVTLSRSDLITFR